MTKEKGIVVKSRNTLLLNEKNGNFKEDTKREKKREYGDKRGNRGEKEKPLIEDMSESIGGEGLTAKEEDSKGKP